MRVIFRELTHCFLQLERLSEGPLEGAQDGV